MKNIHSINFIKHTPLLACSALLAVSLAACSRPAASDAASSATSDTAQIPNPWTGCTTLADAAALTGYDFTVPDSVDGYPEFPKVKDTTSIPRGLLLNRYSRRAG